MPKIIFIEPDGSRRDLEVPVGTSLMQAAVQNGVEGIVGECGGSCMCATCHVLVDEADLARLPPKSDSEDEMLEFSVGERHPGSRLGCQITVTAELDGLTMRVPG